jgi:hypothetical protein
MGLDGRAVTGWIEISFTTYSQEFFLEPSFEPHYTYYSYSSPEALSWQYLAVFQYSRK